MSRRILTTTALAAVALAVPAGANAAPSVDAAAHLEASAVVNSGQALSRLHQSAAQAKRSLQRSELAMKRAYAITIAQGKQSSAKGLDAAASFSASAQQQGDNLQALVDRSRGGLKAAAADALARTSAMEAAVVARVAKGLEQQQSDASAAQGQGVSDVGGAHAQLTATVAVTADSAGLSDGAQNKLDDAKDASVAAQGRLVQAVRDLRDRTEEQGQGSMSSAQDSLQRSWSVDYEKTVSTGDGPVSASATVKTHVGVTNGGRR